LNELTREKVSINEISAKNQNDNLILKQSSTKIGIF